ncbi:MAG: hypothetical protein JWO67_2270 [Streptosporangiaceae bacterium]|nr:hypothetical protein [Streptosporangiaceae bacterium]
MILDIPSVAAAVVAARPGDPDWTEDATIGALLATQNANPPWTAERVWWELALELSKPDAHPRNLIRAANPLTPGGQARPEVVEAIQQAARAAITREDGTVPSDPSPKEHR